MAKKIAWTDQARADVRAIDRQTAIDLLHGLARFLATEEGDVKLLKGIDPPEFRLRIGDYRVRFHDHGDTVEIVHVKHRKDAYR
jgi:mRNA-degrading endonuclease RelE of RelBE toxin-antitoxin system